MIGRPIGLDHGPHCDSGDWYWLCDSCREAAMWDCEEDADDLR